MKKISDLDDIAVVIPSLDPDEQLNKTINGILNEGFSHIILVNDGSPESYQQYFDEAAKHSEVVYLHHPVNRGKGAALKTAFKYILENMPQIIGAVTADGDGQHLPTDIHKIADKLHDNSDEVILGARDLYASNVPGRSTFGNTIALACFRFACGIKLKDTQTGLRGIPRKYLEEMTVELKGDRYDFETHMIVYCAEKKIPLKEQWIETVYLNNNEGTHYKNVSDSLRIAAVLFKNSTFLKQIVTSMLSFITDLGLFWLLSVIITLNDISMEVLVCTASARVCSAILNYFLNRSFVFKNKASIATSAPKYFVVASCMMVLSWLGVSQLVSMITSNPSGRVVIKAIVDGLLFLLSYFVQKKWVFSKGRDV